MNVQRMRLMLACTYPRLAVLLCLLLGFQYTAGAQVIGDLVDVSEDFQKLEQIYFVGSEVADFDPATGRGQLQWNRYVRQANLSFNKLDLALTRAESNEFPGTEYDRDPALPFAIDFVSPRTVRLRFSTRHVPLDAMRAAPP